MWPCMYRPTKNIPGGTMNFISLLPLVTVYIEYMFPMKIITEKD